MKDKFLERSQMLVKMIHLRANNIAEIKTLDSIPEKPESKVNTEAPELNTEEIETNSVNNRSKIDLAKPESVEISEKTAIDVDSKQYSFIRNRRLLTADLVPPKENIAQLVKTFHQFNEYIKQHQLPI